MRLLTSSSTPCVNSSSLPFEKQLFVDQNRDEFSLDAVRLQLSPAAPILPL